MRLEENKDLFANKVFDYLVKLEQKALVEIKKEYLNKEVTTAQDEKIVLLKMDKIDLIINNFSTIKLHQLFLDEITLEVDAIISGMKKDVHGSISASLKFNCNLIVKFEKNKEELEIVRITLNYVNRI